MWNVHSVTVRTTNGSEGWHSKWNGMINKANPNYYEFYLRLQVEQSNTENLIAQAAAGVNPPPPKLRYLRRERKIREFLARYRNPTQRDIASNDVITAARLLDVFSHML